MKRLIIVFLVMFSQPATAQYKNPYFNSLSVEEGLPEGNINAPVQDKSGYIWLGTQGGLIRYDGYGMKAYPMPDDKGKPIAYCSIQSIVEDENGKLWVMVYQQGLFYLDREKDVFRKLKTDSITIKLLNNKFYFDGIQSKSDHLLWWVAFDAKESLQHIIAYDADKRKFLDFSAKGKGRFFIPGYNGLDLFQDVKGQTWLTADSKLFQYSKEKNAFNQIFELPDTSKNFIFYSSIADPVHPEILWLNTDKNGPLQTGVSKAIDLIRFNAKTKEFKVFRHLENDQSSIPGDCIKMQIDSMKRLWFITAKGLSLYNSAEDAFTNYAVSIPHLQSDGIPNIESLATDKLGNLWMGGYFKGLFYMDVKTGKTTFYAHRNAAGSLKDHTGINKVFFDRSGCLWLNMPYYGISYLSHQKSIFNPISVNPSTSEKGRLMANDQYVILSKSGDSTFFVKDSIGLYEWNCYENSYSKIDLKHKIYSQISCVLKGTNGTVWASCNSAGAGLFSFNQKTGEVNHYKNNPSDSTTLPNGGINALVEDALGNIWIGTGRNGVCKLDKRSDKFYRFKFVNGASGVKSEGALDDLTVITLFIDKGGVLWVGTNFGGVNRFDERTNTFKSFSDKKIGFSCVPVIFEDSRQKMWIGTYMSGLFSMDKDFTNIKRFDKQSGLLHNAIIGIAEDDNHHIWISTAQGLSMFNPDINSFTNYPMGIGTYTDNNSLVFKSKNGVINIAVLNGLISFNPAEISNNTIPPSVVIESASYLPADNTINKQDTIVLAHGKSVIKLRYNENKITFQYVALHYADALNNRYAYRLEGYDKEWIQAGTQRTATYTNLSPGTYTFSVKACNSEGVWNEKGDSISIVISPPWWKTWWAYMLYSLAAIGVIFSYIAYRSASLTKENKRLEDKVALRTSQLKATVDNLKATQSQLIQSEKMASLGELTAGIAHEIQNPLNFVNNFSEVNKELLIELKDEIQKGNLEEVNAIADDVISNEEKINHHGKRADAIVKGMLQHSRSSNGIKEPTDINALADEYLRLAYHGLRAKDKSFNATMKTDFDETIGNINIIPQDMGRVILNLITNAFYAVDEKKKSGIENYEPTVTVSTSRSSLSLGEGRGEVLIKVADNGNGIPQKIFDKIFQPFFTTKPTGQGTGLGLSLSYDIVKAHGGELKVETIENEGLPAGQAGTTFTIQLPTT